MKRATAIKAVAAIAAIVGLAVLVAGASGITTVPSITSRENPSLNLLGVQTSQYYNQMILGGVLVAAGFIGFVVGRSTR